MIAEPPLVRENRLYQADWLLRFYKFRVEEIVNENYPDLDLNIDPKLGYALRNLHEFPVDVNKADYEVLLRIPGVGLKSAKMILEARKHGRVTVDHMKKIGVVLKRAKYFISNCGLESKFLQLQPEMIKRNLLAAKGSNPQQLSLFG